MTEWLHIWRGITLSTILGKLHCGINLAVLRIIIEQTVEWQTSLYLNLIDFQKKNFRYHRPSCPVGYLPCNNRGKTRLRLSPLLSMILLDWVNKTDTKSQKASDRLLTSFLEDLEFTDDICTHLTDLQMQKSKITTLNLRLKEQGNWFHKTPKPCSHQTYRFFFGWFISQRWLYSYIQQEATLLAKSQRYESTKALKGHGDFQEIVLNQEIGLCNYSLRNLVENQILF